MPSARLVFVSFLNVITHQKGETQWKLCICVFLLNSFNPKGQLSQTHVRLRESAGEWQVAIRHPRGERFEEEADNPTDVGRQDGFCYGRDPECL